MTREEFAAGLDAEMQAIKELFAIKNGSYGKGADVFHNFRASAERVHGHADLGTMFTVLYTYLDKHLVALANGGPLDPEFEDRLRDVIVYSLLALGMYRAETNG